MENKNEGCPIAEVLEGEERDLHLSNEDRKLLVEVLGMTGAMLRDGKLWFNEPGERNKKYADFCNDMAERFANMPVHNEN